MAGRLRGRKLVAALAALPLASGLVLGLAGLPGATAGAVTEGPLTTLPVGGTPVGVAVDTGNGTVFVANANGMVVGVKEQTGLPVSSYSVASSASAIALDPGAGLVDVTDAAAGTLTVVDESNGAVVSTATVGSDPVAVAVDTTTHLAYVANYGSGTVSEVNETTGVVTGTATVGTDPDAVAVDSANGEWAVANGGGGTLSLGTGTTASQTVPVGGRPDGVAFDPTTRTIGVANSSSGNLSIVSEKSASVTATVQVGADPAGVAVDPSTSHFVVVDEGSSAVSFVSESSRTLDSTVPVGADPVGIAIDTKRGMVEVVNGTGGTLTTLNELNSFPSHLATPVLPTAVGVNPSSGQIAVVVGSTGQVLLYSSFTAKRSTSVNVGSSPDAVALDPSSGDWFVANGASSSVSVVSPSGSVLDTVRVGADPLAMAMDSSSGEAYVACGTSHEFVAIDTSTDATSTVKVTPATPTGIAVDPATARVFVAEGTSNKVAAYAEGSTTREWRVTVPSPAGLAFDTATNTLLATDSSGALLSQVSISTHKNVPLAVPAASTSVVVDPASGTAWIASPSISPPAGDLTRLDLGTGDALATLPVTSLGGIAFDTSTFQIYAVVGSMTGPGAVLAAGGPAVPGEPTSLDATPGDRTIDVSWTAPPSGDDAITSYAVGVYEQGSESAVDTTTTAAGTTNASISGLTNGQAYVIAVVAKSGAGTGQAAFSAAVTPVTVPTAPTAVAATATNSQAVVTWTAPTSDGGTPITSYTVTPFVSGVAVSSLAVIVTGNPPATQATVTNLTDGTSYTFEVLATNGVGPSAESKPSSAVTPLGPPGAPTAVSATGSNASANVTWTAPSSDGGTAIESYTVTPYLAGTPVPSLAVTVSGSPPATNALVHGLTNGDAYQFGVVATNSVGSSAPSQLSPAVTPAGAPSSPRDAKAEASEGEAGVSWKAPDSNGAPITSYVVTPVEAGTPEPSKAVTVSGSAGSPPGTSVTVRGLIDGMPYGFSVVARNSAGTSKPATTSQVTPVHGVWVASSTGKVVGVGVASLGSGPSLGAHAQYVAMLTEPEGLGYLLIGSNGSVHAFGDAQSHGSLKGRTVVAAALTPDGGGYLLLLAGGRVKTFGDARSYGSLHDEAVVGVEYTPDGKGYAMWLANGAVKTFGDAKSYGSLHDETVTAGAFDSAGNGYYLLSSDGEVHRYGKAAWFGSTKALGYALIPSAIAVIPGGKGYLELSTDGGLYAFGPGTTAYAEATGSVVARGHAIGIGLEP
ncbi:MAG: fibronectin type III domain-containing protein [Acidimicrobiales bacterium]|jgi:YVTN family beta-propeller protein